MRRTIIVLLVVMVALATATPAYAAKCTRDDRPECGARKAQPSVQATTGGFRPYYLVDFSKYSKAVVKSACGLFRIRLFDEPSNLCFYTKWSAMDFNNGGSAYTLWIFPLQQIWVKAFR